MGENKGHLRRLQSGGGMLRNNGQRPNIYITTPIRLHACSPFLGGGANNRRCDQRWQRGVPARDGQMGGSCPGLAMAELPALWFPLPWP